jgi:hypothetical protein
MLISPPLLLAAANRYCSARAIREDADGMGLMSKGKGTQRGGKRTTVCQLTQLARRRIAYRKKVSSLGIAETYVGKIFPAMEFLPCWPFEHAV